MDNDKQTQTLSYIIVKVDVGIQVGEIAPVSAYYHLVDEEELEKEESRDMSPKGVKSSSDLNGADASKVPNKVISFTSPEEANASGGLDGVEVSNNSDTDSNPVEVVISTDIQPDSNSPGEISGDIIPSVELGIAAELEAGPGQVVAITRCFESQQTRRRRWKKAVNIRKAVNRFSSSRQSRREQLMNDAQDDGSDPLAGGYRRIVYMDNYSNGTHIKAAVESTKADRTERIEAATGASISRRDPNDDEKQGEMSGLDPVICEEIPTLLDKDGKSSGACKLHATIDEAMKIAKAEQSFSEDRCVFRDGPSWLRKIAEREEESEHMDPLLDLQVDVSNSEHAQADIIIHSRSFEAAPSPNIAVSRWNKLRVATTTMAAFQRMQRSTTDSEGNEADSINTASGFLSSGYRRVSLSGNEAAAWMKSSGNNNSNKAKKKKKFSTRLKFGGKSQTPGKQGKWRYKGNKHLSVVNDEEDMPCLSPTIH